MMVLEKAKMTLPAGWGKGAGLAFLLLALGLVAMAEIAFGPVSIGFVDMVRVFTGDLSGKFDVIIFQIRLPRAILGMMTGAALALSGCALQGILRNPLADPGLIGVTAGASAGAVLIIVLGSQVLDILPHEFRPYALPVAAFLGSALVTAFVFSVARHAKGTSIGLLILSGVAVNAIAGAVIGALVYISDDEQLRDLTFWSMGSIANGDWVQVSITSCLVIVTGFMLLRLGKVLDLFQLGERAAFHAGLDIEREKRRVALCTALAVGGVTAAAGPIGFIGLVAPHMARIIAGPSHRLVLPVAALIGAILVLLADLAVRLVVPPTEPPIGLATSLIGGPFFLWLLLSRLRQEKSHA